MDISTLRIHGCACVSAFSPTGSAPVAAATITTTTATGLGVGAVIGIAVGVLLALGAAGVYWYRQSEAYKVHPQEVPPTIGAYFARICVCACVFFAGMHV